MAKAKPMSGMKMTTQQRTAVVASSLALTALAILAGGCPGVGTGSPFGLGSGSDCIRVKTGEWEFDLSTGGHAFLSFVGNNLTQSGCHLAYNEGRIFEGDLNGSTWNVSSDAGGFRFAGVFSGNPATTFSGTFIDSKNNDAEISGRYVGR